jgi:hypothetical protein
MNNNYHLSINEQKQIASNHFYSVYHAPLIVDINTQSCYRKEGYVSWPEVAAGKEPSLAEDTLKTLLGGGGYSSWPEAKVINE